MLIGYGALNVVVLIGRIGSASGTTDSSGSAGSIGQSITCDPSDSFTLCADGVVNTRPLLAAPTDRLCPVPMTPIHRPPAPPSALVLPPPQLASARSPTVSSLVRRIGARQSTARDPGGKSRWWSAGCAR